MGSPYLFNGLFFSLPWFYRSGFDVLLYTLPFHGRRAMRGSPFGGYGYFQFGMAGFAEAIARPSTISARRWTTWSPPASTASPSPECHWAATSSLIAGVDDRLQAVIPNVPVVAEMFDDWFPANKLVALGRKFGGMSTESSFAASAYPPH